MKITKQKLEELGFQEVENCINNLLLWDAEFIHLLDAPEAIGSRNFVLAKGRDGIFYNYCFHSRGAEIKTLGDLVCEMNTHYFCQGEEAKACEIRMALNY